MSGEKSEKKSTKPRAEPTHPPIKDMVVAAITGLKERKGSSLPAIKKHISANNPTADVTRLAVFIRKCLKSGVEKGTFVQIKASYKMAEKPKAEKKPKAKKEVKEKKSKAESKEKKTKKPKTPKKPAAKKAPKKVTKKPKATPAKKEKKPDIKTAKKPAVKKPKTAKVQADIKTAKKPAVKKPKTAKGQAKKAEK